MAANRYHLLERLTCTPSTSGEERRCGSLSLVLRRQVKAVNAHPHPSAGHGRGSKQPRDAPLSSPSRARQNSEMTWAMAADTWMWDEQFFPNAWSSSLRGLSPRLASWNPFNSSFAA
ncbi:uncharacterized protein LOC144256440 [Urocitellus parryii]